MPRSKKDVAVSAGVGKPAKVLFAPELMASLVNAPIDSSQFEELVSQFKKALIERALNAEMTHHLGYAADQPKPAESSNMRNGTSAKTVLTNTGALRIDVPRDRQAQFEPELIGKHQRRFAGFDDKIIALYARGMTVREIRAHMAELYGMDVSPDLISSVSDELMSEVQQWQQRPLEEMYPVVFFDCLRVKIRDEGTVRSKAVYLALGMLRDGSRDILGLWIEQTEGAKFWMKVFTDLKVRGVQDILIAVTDGLKGMPEALEAVYPQTTLQSCIVHLMRNSLDYAGWQERKALAAAIRPIYTAASAEQAQAELDAFEASAWGKKFPMVTAAWRRAWDRVVPFFAFAPEVRRVIYTTNAIESVNARLRKIIKTRGHFPSDESATKLMWLALRNITKDWTRAATHWKQAMVQFALVYGQRFERANA
jgi:putative transposase